MLCLGSKPVFTYCDLCRAPMLRTWKYLSTAQLALPFSLKTNTLIFRHESLIHSLNRSPGAYNIVQNLYEMGNDVISSFLKDNRWIRKDCVSSTNAAVYSQNFQSGRLVSVNSVAIPGMKRKEKHPNCCVLEQPEQVCEAYAESNPLPGAQLRQTCCVGWC